MSKKPSYILILDTESSIAGNCVDLGFQILKNGCVLQKENRHFLVYDYYLTEELFHTKNSKDFAKSKLAVKHEYYKKQLTAGDCTLVSIAYLQSYFDSIKERYPDIILWAYNVKYDMGLLASSGLFLDFETKC